MKISKMSPRSFSSGMRLTRRSKSSNELRSSKRALVDLERARLLFQKFVQEVVPTKTPFVRPRKLKLHVPQSGWRGPYPGAGYGSLLVVPHRFERLGRVLLNRQPDCCLAPANVRYWG